MNLVIEVDTPNCGNLFFYPADRIIRGRWSHLRMKEPNAAMLVHQWGDDGIPGQRITFDLRSGEAAIEEPLHDPEYRELAKKIEKRGYKLAPARQTFPMVDDNAKATWIHWMKRAIDDGTAKLVRGDFPAKLPGVAKTRFGTTVASDASGDKVDKLLAIVMALLPADKRAEAERLLAQ